jgi:hypothetical protein
MLNLTRHRVCQAPAGSSASGKRPLPPAPGDHGEEGPRLNLIAALPLSVCQEHLQPLLSVKEAARLRVSCKALKVLVMGWPMRLIALIPPGKLGAPDKLEAALTCFPVTETLNVHCEQPRTPAEELLVVELLRQHGGTLQKVLPTGEGGRRLLRAAVLAGALPNLTRMCLFINEPVDRQILSEGMLGLLEDVAMALWEDDAEELAALEHLRRLPHLRRLTLALRRPGAAFRHFIPPSLKSFGLMINRLGLLESLLRELPSMLQASGAALEEIAIGMPNGFSAGLGAVLAQVFRACSSTLKIFEMRKHVCEPGVWGPRLSDCAREMVPGLVSCCATLEVLHCPWAVFSALPATCHTFPRLTELTLSGGPDKDVNFTPRVWDIMANGRLPVLASFSTIIWDSVWGQWEGEGEEEGARRLARAFEGVGGTLKRLTLRGVRGARLAGQGLLRAWCGDRQASAPRGARDPQLM